MVILNSVQTMWIRAIISILMIGGAALADGRVLAETRRDGSGLHGFLHQPANFLHRAKVPVLLISDITRAQAVRAAIRCNGGGEALKAPVPKGEGFVVKVLKGSYVRFIHVDKNGQCG